MSNIKLCFILSSAGGTKMLAPLLSGNCREETAFIVIQDRVGDDILDIFVDAVREESGRKINKVLKTSELKSGYAYFLSRDHHYRLEHSPLRLIRDSTLGVLDANTLLKSAAKTDISCCAIVLSGFFREGLDGLKSLAEGGCGIWAATTSQTPIADMVLELQELKILEGQDALKNLLEQVKFRPCYQDLSSN